MGAADFFGGFLESFGSSLLKNEERAYEKKLEDARDRKAILASVLQDPNATWGQKATALQRLGIETAPQQGGGIGSLIGRGKGKKGQRPQPNPFEPMIEGFRQMDKAAQPPAQLQPLPETRGVGPSIQSLQPLPQIRQGPGTPAEAAERAKVQSESIGRQQEVADRERALATSDIKPSDPRYQEYRLTGRMPDIATQARIDVERDRLTMQQKQWEQTLQLRYDQIQERLTENRERLRDRALDRAARREISAQNAELRREMIDINRQRVEQGSGKAGGAAKLSPQLKSGLDVLHVSLFGDPQGKTRGLRDTLDIFDSQVSRAKLATMPTLLSPPESPSAVGNLMRSAQSSFLTPAEREFVRQHARAVSAIQALRSVTGLPRSTQQLMQRYVAELPNPSIDKSKEEAMERLALIEREINAAVSGSGTTTGGDLPPGWEPPPTR